MTDYAEDVARLRGLLERWDSVPPGDDAFAVCQEINTYLLEGDVTDPCNWLPLRRILQAIASLNSAAAEVLSQSGSISEHSAEYATANCPLCAALVSLSAAYRPPHPSIPSTTDGMNE